METLIELIDSLESIIFENLPTILVVSIIIGTYIYMNRPPTPKVSIPIKKSDNSSSSQSNNSSSSSSNKQAKKDTIKSENSSSNTLKIFFGTQTRTAEDFSHIIEKESKKIGIPCEVVDLENYDPEDLAKEHFAIFLVSTHGEGDPTDNAKDFYNWLISSEREPLMMSQLRFTVFGLGNKTYEHYNKVARVIDKRLEELGGIRSFEKGEGDDDATLEEDFIHWKKRMWPVVCDLLGYQMKSTEDDKFVARFRMVNLNGENHDLENSYVKIVAPRNKPKMTSDNKVQYDIKNPFLATVCENRELHGESSDRSCRHLEFDISGGTLYYEVGDHLGINPINDSKLVNSLIERLGVNGDSNFAMIPIDKAGSVIEASFGPMTIRKAFQENLDITNPPRKAVLRALSEYTQDPKHKADLIRLASEEASEEYNQFIKYDCRTIGEVLDCFPSVKPPISHFIELLPRLPARYYSISSSLNHSPGRVTITSVVVNYTTPTKRLHNGVCSTWLSNLKVGDKIPIFIRESHFRLPSQLCNNNSSNGATIITDNKIPSVIMVGPGTGLAPFRGFLQEIKFRKSKLSSEQVSSFESLVYFGCRDDNIDYLYKDELEQFVKDGTVSHLNVAFSRKTTEKIYVQNKLIEDKERIWNLISNGAHFYVCGDARNMAKQVQQSLISIVREFGKINDENEVTQFIDNLQKSGRYLQDVWF